jgi:hypothetical protein
MQHGRSKPAIFVSNANAPTYSSNADAPTYSLNCENASGQRSARKSKVFALARSSAALFPLKFCALLLGTSSRGVGTLPGCVCFERASSSTGSCDWILLPVLCCLSSQSTCSASANQCRATSLNASLTLRSVLCAALFGR